MTKTTNKPKPKQPLTNKPPNQLMTIKNNRAKWALIVLLLFTALLYIKAIFNDFVWDDEMYILKNPYLRNFSFEGIKAIFNSYYFYNYHPLTTLTYLFEYKCFGLNPLPYHLINIILHLFNTWLVFILIKQFCNKSITALVVSILFAVHPMHVESVAWVSERKDVLYSMFYLLTLISYNKYSKSENKRKYYINTLLLFIASLLSKPAAVTLPVLLFAIDIYNGKKISKNSLIEKAPFLLLSLALGIITIYAQQAEINELPLPYTYIERIFLLSYTVSFYIIKLLAPFGLCAIHYYPDTHGGSLPWQYYVSFVFILLIIVLIFKHNLFRKEILFGIAFFIITISVMLQIIPVGSALASERYTYVPYIGLFYIIGKFISYIYEKHTQLKNIILIIFSLLVILFLYQTWRRVDIWKNGNVLFTDVINKNPEIGYGYWLRGNIRKNNNDLQGALYDYNKTLQYNTEFVPCLINRGNIQNSLGYYNEALQDLNHALTIDSNLQEAFINRAIANENLGNLSQALNDYNKTIKLNPCFTFAYNSRSILKAKTGDIDGALIDINKAIELNPADAKTFCNRGNIKAMIKDFIGSIEDYTKAIQLKSNDKTTYYNRGLSYFNINDTAKACSDWQKAQDLGDVDASQKIKQYCN